MIILKNNLRKINIKRNNFDNMKLFNICLLVLICKPLNNLIKSRNHKSQKLFFNEVLSSR